MLNDLNGPQSQEVFTFLMLYKPMNCAPATGKQGEETIKENAASIAMLKKVGFPHEGSLKNYRYYHGRSHDVEMFAITPEMRSNQKLEKSWARHETF